MTPLKPELLDEFVRVAAAMSPENLTWDGERPVGQVRRAMAKLRAEWKALEYQQGRRVSEDEVWDALREERNS